MNGTGNNLGQIDSALAVLLVLPLVQAGNEADKVGSTAIHGHGSDHFAVFYRKVILLSFLIQGPHPHIPACVLTVGSVVVEFNGDLIVVNRLAIAHNNHIVVILADGQRVLGVIDPSVGGSFHELVLIDAGLKGHGAGINTVRALGHLIGGGTPAVHGACDYNAGSGTLVAESHLIALNFRADDQLAGAVHHGAAMNALSGSAGLYPQFRAAGLIQGGVVYKEVFCLVTAIVMEDVTNAFARSGLIADFKGIIAIGIHGQSLAGPCHAVVSTVVLAPLHPGIGANAFPAGGVDEMDLNGVAGGIRGNRRIGFLNRIGNIGSTGAPTGGLGGAQTAGIPVFGILGRDVLNINIGSLVGAAVIEDAAQHGGGNTLSFQGVPTGVAGISGELGAAPYAGGIAVAAPGIAVNTAPVFGVLEVNDHITGRIVGIPACGSHRTAGTGGILLRIIAPVFAAIGDAVDLDIAGLLAAIVENDTNVGGGNTAEFQVIPGAIVSILADLGTGP